MKTLVKNAALDLIAATGSTTTLEVKEELINTQPTYYWKQSFISAALAELADNGELTFTHNGLYRTYELPTASPSVLVSMLSQLGNNVATTSQPARYKKIPLTQRNVVKVNLTELAKLVESNAGKFVGLVHKKKTTGQLNTMNCQVLKGLTPLGQIQVKEQGQLKTIYPTDLLEVRLKNIVYQLK